MTSKTFQTTVPNGEVIGIYNDRASASEILQAIASSGIPDQKVSIDDHVTYEGKLKAMGTTTGGEAGFLLGAFYGGILAMAAATTTPVLMNIPANSTFNRLLILGFTIVGGVVGLISGKQAYAKQSKEQKQKSDPSIPRQFRVVVQGSQDEVEQAKSVVRDVEVNH